MMANVRLSTEPINLSENKIVMKPRENPLGGRFRSRTLLKSLVHAIRTKKGVALVRNPLK